MTYSTPLRVPAAREAREAERIAAAEGAFGAKREALAQRPHPCIPQQTLADYVDWLLANAGRSGRLRAARLIEAA